MWRQRARYLEESSTEEGRSHADKAREASNTVPVSPTGLGGGGSTGGLASGGRRGGSLRSSTGNRASAGSSSPADGRGRLAVDLLLDRRVELARHVGQAARSAYHQKSSQWRGSSKTREKGGRT